MYLNGIDFKSIVMIRKTVIPRGTASFTEYIRIAYDTAEKNRTAYNINPGELAKLKPLLDNFIRLELLCINPATAVKVNRAARNAARRTLEKQWRVFLNKEIRLNDAISMVQKAIFCIFPHDTVRTPVSSPKGTGTVTLMRTGERHFIATVKQSVTGKPKCPADAAGSNLYAAITEVNEPAPPHDAFRFMGFSSRCRHTVVFDEKYYVRRAWLYVCYTSRHGQEGPKGPLASVIIC
jgi:hypothetical protein